MNNQPQIRRERMNEKTGTEIYEAYLCPIIRAAIKALPIDFKRDLEEIRLRINRPLMVYGGNKDYFLASDGRLLRNSQGAIMVTRKDIDLSIQFISNYSFYSVEEEIKRGYITIAGGHRIGLSGKVLYDGKSIRTMKDFNGLNFRIAREKKGAAKAVMPYLYHKGKFLNTLIVSPPQCGKTTLLRDIILNVSNGNASNGILGLKVGVVDERSELAASCNGIPQLDLGIRTDILDSCPKAEGMMILIRAMSPNVIATDEIGREEDSYAISEALLAGIKLITTVHGTSLEDIYGKKVIGDLVKNKVFERMIILSNKNDIGTIESIIDVNTKVNLIGTPIRNKVVN
ncbi:stage III sporulation protein AA [Alkaliphilus serpentinus]|uniref:Stage III sporulation protein AA n=2 Tax=Alkaliphilus serpentinus TaxID=1482731 RepID=A0A833MDC3_9FIRM|nr:stage III sporulation protein AA [Alkaliphilus serpentinus]